MSFNDSFNEHLFCLSIFLPTSTILLQRAKYHLITLYNNIRCLTNNVCLSVMINCNWVGDSSCLGNRTLHLECLFLSPRHSFFTFSNYILCKIISYVFISLPPYYYILLKVFFLFWKLMSAFSWNIKGLIRSPISNCIWKNTKIYLFKELRSIHGYLNRWSK